MAGIGEAASIIAVIELASDILGGCRTYFTKVRDARGEITRLRDEVTIFSDVLSSVNDLADSQDSSDQNLSCLRLLNQPDGPLRQSQAELEKLAQKLDVGREQNQMQRFGARALKWPFTSKEVDKTIETLERNKRLFGLALERDEVALQLEITKTLAHLKKESRDTRRDTAAALQYAVAIRSGLSENAAELSTIGTHVAANVARASEIHSAVIENSEGLLTIRSDVAASDAKVSQIQSGVSENGRAMSNLHSELREAEDKKLRQQIIGWLSVGDPATNHYAARQKHEPTTGEWLLEREEFQNWERQPGTLLWLHGLPGCGKTIIASTVIELLTERQAGKAFPGVVSYFSIRFDDIGSQSAATLFSTVISQILQKMPVLPQDATELYYSRCNNGARKPSIIDLRHLMANLLLSEVIVPPISESAIDEKVWHFATDFKWSKGFEALSHVTDQTASKRLQFHCKPDRGRKIHLQHAIRRL